MAEDVSAVERAIQTLHDRLHSATRLSHENLADKQRLSYAAFVDNDPSATADLEKLRHRGVELADTIDGIKAAIAEADRRLAQARDALARDADKEHARAALAVLESLLALAPRLDELVPHPRPEDGVALYSQNDPPTVCAAAELIAVLVNEHLRALKLGGEASFPKFWHGAANKMDLEKALMKCISAGWPTIVPDIAPRVRSQVMPGQPQRNPEFRKILGGWGAVIRKNLAQQQTNKEVANAAA